ncbi:MAG: hypothetical protein ACOX7K_09960 [Oscillospiraceae bacterium]|jgi:hypothetical protein
MRAEIFRMIPQYGRQVTIFSDQSPSGRAENGILQPIGALEDSTYPRTYTMPGLRQNRRYRLFLLPEAMRRNEQSVRVVCDGEEYELMKAEAYVVGNVQTHWEGILRLKGDAQHD